MRSCFATSSAPTGFGPMLYAGRVREAVAVSRELGFDGIEISLRHPEELERRELEALLERVGARAHGARQRPLVLRGRPVAR